MIICPIDCPDRTPTCHGNCEIYKEGKRKLDEKNDARWKVKQLEDAIYKAKYGNRRSKKKK